MKIRIDKFKVKGYNKENNSRNDIFCGISGGFYE